MWGQVRSGKVGNGGGTMATSGQSPAASQMAARSRVEANDAVQWHSTTPIATPITPGTTRLAAGRWKPPPPRRFDASHLDPSGKVENGGGSMATSGQSPAASQMAARSCVEANDAVQWHSTTPITTPITPGTTRLAAGRWKPPPPRRFDASSVVDAPQALQALRPDPAPGEDPAAAVQAATGRNARQGRPLRLPRVHFLPEEVGTRPVVPSFEDLVQVHHALPARDRRLASTQSPPAGAGSTRSALPPLGGTLQLFRHAVQPAGVLECEVRAGLPLAQVAQSPLAPVANDLAPLQPLPVGPPPTAKAEGPQPRPAATVRKPLIRRAGCGSSARPVL